MIVKVVSVAHSPTAGVKEYDVVVVLSSAGDHAPVTPFVDVKGNGERKSPEQIAETGSKAGAVGTGP